MHGKLPMGQPRVSMRKFQSPFLMGCQSFRGSLVLGGGVPFRVLALQSSGVSSRPSGFVCLSDLLFAVASR